MSLQDFDLCTPLEFEKIFERWRIQAESDVRRSWEQTRQLAVVILQPYAQQPLCARDVMKFEWDEESESCCKTCEKSAEERAAERRHYEEVKKARGLK